MPTRDQSSPSPAFSIQAYQKLCQMISSATPRTNACYVNLETVPERNGSHEFNPHDFAREQEPPQVSAELHGEGLRRAKRCIWPGRLDQSARRAPQLNEDVQIEILYCGVCHVDIHWSRKRLGELLSRRLSHRARSAKSSAGLLRAGTAVAKFKEGDLVGVGCTVDSCRKHFNANCQEGEEQYCSSMVLTYNAPDKHLGWRYSTAAIPKVSWSVTPSRCASQRRWISRQPRHCYAPVSPPMRLSAAEKWAKARRSALSDLAGWDIWPLNLPPPWEPTWWSSPLHPAKPLTLSASVLTK